MPLSDFVTTFGQAMIARYGERVHKLAIDAGFTCPNRDGTKGTGGCTFCNNSSFSPNVLKKESIVEQIDSGRSVIAKRTGARRFVAYFQAYTNTYDDIAVLRKRYDTALAQPGVIGLAIGTRPDCVPEPVLDLLSEYQSRGYEIGLELGLQSSFDATLKRVNRGHGFSEYRVAVHAARTRGLPVCTHLILGLPGEEAFHACTTLLRVLDEGVDGLKLHPLYVVKGTRLANEWRKGEYRPLDFREYVSLATELVEMTPRDVIYHRLTGTAPDNLLITPHWCSWKWRVLNAIEFELVRRNTCQGQKQNGVFSYEQHD